jgi:nucleotide-binding universal stress UspA family protein
MFERILVAVDGSDHSMRAVVAAKDLAQKSNGEVRVVHVHEREFPAVRGAVGTAETPAQAGRLVERYVKELEAGGVSTSGDARASGLGGAAREILHSAEEFDAGLVIMGTRGLSDFAGLLLGSVAHKVIHHARCPVMVVR